MKKVCFAVINMFFVAFSFAQPSYLNQVIERYQIPNGFKSTVQVRIDIPGLIAPPKTIEIYAEKGKKPKIKGDGLILLPKKGFVEQFNDLLTSPGHWILLNSSGEYENFKLVSLDPKSEWITADIKFFKPDPRIEELNLTTRDTGEYLIKYSYNETSYPVKSEISFETDRLNIPLKFMGKSDLSEIKDSNGKVGGKIYVVFENFEVF